MSRLRNGLPFVESDSVVCRQLGRLRVNHFTFPPPRHGGYNRGTGPYRLPPKTSLAEHWEEIRQTPRRHLIAALMFLGLITFGVLDILLRMRHSQ